MRFSCGLTESPPNLLLSQRKSHIVDDRPLVGVDFFALAVFGRKEPHVTNANS